MDYLALVPTENRAKLAKILSPKMQEAMERDKLVTVSEMQAYLEARGDLTNHIRTLLMDAPGLLNTYGGISRDSRPTSGTNGAIRDSIRYLLGELKREFNPTGIYLGPASQRTFLPGAQNQARIIELVAKLEVALAESSRISLPIIAAEFRAPTLSTTSPLHRLVMQSELFGPNSPLRESLFGN